MALAIKTIEYHFCQICLGALLSSIGLVVYVCLLFYVIFSNGKHIGK